MLELCIIFSLSSFGRNKMARPVTLFTGQWADLPLAELAKKAASWGYDGMELACWGDHFEVDKALEEDDYCNAKREMLKKLDLELFATSTHYKGILSDERRCTHVKDSLGRKFINDSIKGVHLCLGYEDPFNDLEENCWGKCRYLGELSCNGSENVFRNNDYERNPWGTSGLLEIVPSICSNNEYRASCCPKSPWGNLVCPFYYQCLATRVKRDLLRKEQKNGSPKKQLYGRSLGMSESVLGPSRDARPYPSYVFW